MSETCGIDLPVIGCVGTGVPGLDVFLATLSALAVFSFGLSMKLLGGETWRVRIGLWLLDARWSTAYAGLLERTLKGLDWVFGPSFSLGALDMCFRLAVAYSFGYVAMAFVGDYWSADLNKTLYVTSFVVTVALITWAFRKIAGFRMGWVRSSAWAAWFLKHLLLLLASVLLLFSVAIGQVLLGEREIILGGVVVGALIGTLLGWGLGAGLVLGTVMLWVALGGGGFTGDAHSVVILIVIVPVLNALFDWPSWAASRWLMGRLRADAGRARLWQRLTALAGHLVLDLGLAILCLFGLSIVISNLWHAAGIPEFWGGWLAGAAAAPFSERGAAMTIMLASTLVPTAIHLFFALFALAAVRPPAREAIVRWTDDAQGGKEWGNRAVVSAYLSFWVVFAVAVLWGFTVAVLHGLDAAWIALGWADPQAPYPFWASIFEAAGHFVVLGAESTHDIFPASPNPVSPRADPGA